jgi:hypothetical protein
MIGTGFDAKHLSTVVKKACKAMHFTPRRFEVLNADRSVNTFDPAYDEDFNALRIWNSKCEIVLTADDIASAERYL